MPLTSIKAKEGITVLVIPSFNFTINYLTINNFVTASAPFTLNFTM
jgi:hypothetical protein